MKYYVLPIYNKSRSLPVSDIKYLIITSYHTSSPTHTVYYKLDNKSFKACDNWWYSVEQDRVIKDDYDTIMPVKFNSISYSCIGMISHTKKTLTSEHIPMFLRDNIILYEYGLLSASGGYKLHERRVDTEYYKMCHPLIGWVKRFGKRFEDVNDGWWGD